MDKPVDLTEITLSHALGTLYGWIVGDESGLCDPTNAVVFAGHHQLSRDVRHWMGRWLHN